MCLWCGLIASGCVTTLPVVDDTKYGVASIEYVPQASRPVLDSAVRARLTSGDGEIEGIILRGTGISVDVQIFADDRLLDPKTVQRDVVSARKVLLAAPLPLGARIYVENPGGQRSQSVQVTDG
jgi:hypothetical protein